MKNAFKYGLLIGVLSAVWILILQSAGIYDDAYPRSGNFSIMEMFSIVIPFVGLFFGIRNFRNNNKSGKMEFFEGLIEGFKIMLVGGVLTGAFVAIYAQYVSEDMKIDFMNRVVAAGIVGILMDIVCSLLLMNKQKRL